MRIGDAKQSYEADEAIWTSQTQKLWLGLFLLILLVFPFVVNSYLLYLGCLVGIAVISTTGLNILTGFTGLISLGQAGFMGVGAYTGGMGGLSLEPAHLFGLTFQSDFRMYFIIVPLAVLMVLAARNVFRTRIGRAFIAIRDRDISAEILGINLLRYKLMSFALSSFYAGIAGGLFAYFYRVVTPESFPLSMSIFYLAAALIVGFLIFEPHGLAEIWHRIRRFFRLWPFRN